MSKFATFTSESRPKLFGENARPAQVVPANQMVDKDVDFNSYCIRPGDIIFFPKYEEALVLEQPVFKNSKAKVYYVGVKVSNQIRGQKFVDTYFNINSTKKRDIDNVHVHAEFQYCENLDERLKKLCEWGAIEHAGEKEITVPVFDEGKPKMKVVTNADGSEISEMETKQQKVQLFKKHALTADEKNALK